MKNPTKRTITVTRQLLGGTLERDYIERPGRLGASIFASFMYPFVGSARRYRLTVTRNPRGPFRAESGYIKRKADNIGFTACWLPGAWVLGYNVDLKVKVLA